MLDWFNSFYSTIFVHIYLFVWTEGDLSSWGYHKWFVQSQDEQVAIQTTPFECRSPCDARVRVSLITISFDINSGPKMSVCAANRCQTDLGLRGLCPVDKTKETLLKFVFAPPGLGRHPIERQAKGQSQHCYHCSNYSGNNHTWHWLKVWKCLRVQMPAQIKCHQKSFKGLP